MTVMLLGNIRHKQVNIPVSATYTDCFFRHANVQFLTDKLQKQIIHGLVKEACIAQPGS